MDLMNNAGGNETFAKELYRKIWITRGTRFNSHKRLMSRHNWSLASIAFSSAYVLIISIIGYIPLATIDSQRKDVITLSAIVLSLFILVLSLLEASKNYQIKAKDFHDCARKMSPLYGELRKILALEEHNIAETKISSRLAEIQIQYDTILDQCQDNHDAVDFDVFQSQHYRDFNINTYSRVLIQIRSWFCTFLPYLVIIIIVPIIIILLLILL